MANGALASPMEIDDGNSKGEFFLFHARRPSTICFCLIIQSWPCPWCRHVDIAGVQAFYTGGHSHEEDHHLRAIKISPQFSKTVKIPTAHHEFGAK